MSARLIQVIETDLDRRGAGKILGDPIRSLKQYWSTDGELLAEVDQFSAEGIKGLFCIGCRADRRECRTTLKSGFMLCDACVAGVASRKGDEE